MAFRPEFADAQLAELVDAIVHGRHIDAITLDWLLRGVLGAVRRDESLDQALGLSGPGVERLRGRLLRLQRDEHLAKAALAMALDDCVSLWDRCVRLQPLVRRFEARTWRLPAVQTLAEAPSDWPTWKAHLLRARQTGLPLPNSARGLHERLKSTPPFCVHTSKATVLARYL